MAYRFAGWLEGKICEGAAVVIWFVDTARDRARKRHPVLGNRGKVMIPGADRPAFGKISYQRGTELVIGHFGSLSPTRNLAIFMEGLTALLRKRPDLSKILRLEIYGSGLDAVSGRAIDSFAYPEVVRRFGRLARPIV